MSGFASTATGVITFDPPLTATDIRNVTGVYNAPQPGRGPAELSLGPLPNDIELVLLIDETVEVYDEAEIHRSSASRLIIGFGDQAWNRRHVEDQLRRFVADWGAGRTFTGRIEEHSAEGDRWATRYEVVVGEVVRTPGLVDGAGNLTWPDECPPPAGVELLLAGAPVVDLQAVAGLHADLVDARESGASCGDVVRIVDAWFRRHAFPSIIGGE